LTPQKRKGPSPKERILRAAEEILEKDGYAAISTRRLATTAGVNQALVHYYFGSVSQVMMSVTERTGLEADEWTREAFSGDAPDAEKWHNYLDMIFTTRIDSGSAKRWFEAVAMAANDDEMKDRICPRFEEVRSTYESHLDGVLVGLGFEADESQRLGLSVLIQAAIYGTLLEILIGYRHGHAEMIALIDQILKVRPNPK
jgi:AcrR family transcriptional regulator